MLPTSNRWLCLLLIFPFIAESSAIPFVRNTYDTGRSQPLFGCSAEIFRYSECLLKCNDSSSCVSQELSNFLTACMSGETQNCTDQETTLPPPTEMPPSGVECGIENLVPATDDRDTRIVSGVAVNVARKYSWQVGLKGNTKEGPYECGGSIITNKHILTAAHCFVGYLRDGQCRINIPDKIYVGIGDHNQHAASDNLPDLIEPILKQFVNIHPEYNCNLPDNDIAVMELNKSIDLEKYADEIHPICLPKDDSDAYTNVTATVTGWGSTEGYNRPLTPGLRGTPFNLPNVLQEAQVTVWNNSICSIKIDDLRDTMICSETNKGFETNGTGICDRDFGGPLSVKENDRHVEIGIISAYHANGCASKGNPNVYTRVSKFLKWIKMQVGSETTYTAT